MDTPTRQPLTRELIVGTAREMIRAAGVEALSLRRVAAHLGVTAPALYGYVTDKRDLVAHVAAGEFGELASHFKSAQDRDPLTRVRAHARAYIRYAQVEPELFRVMFLFAPHIEGSAAQPFELPAATEVFALASEALTAAVEAGQVHTDDPLVLALAMWAATHGVATVVQMGLHLGAEFEERLADKVVEAMLLGFGASEND